MIPSGHPQFCTEAIHKNNSIKDNWVLLDTFSLVSVLNNSYLAKNFRNCNSEEKLLMLMNGGNISFNHMEDLLLLSIKVYINESSMANILSFA